MMVLVSDNIGLNLKNTNGVSKDITLGTEKFKIEGNSKSSHTNNLKKLTY